MLGGRIIGQFFQTLSAPLSNVAPGPRITTKNFEFVLTLFPIVGTMGKDFLQSIENFPSPSSLHTNFFPLDHFQTSTNSLFFGRKNFFKIHCTVDSVNISQQSTQIK